MSKIICDICGTSYADTATQCPICGCVRPVQVQSVPEEETTSSYTYVKGGRFSKGNVKKRTTAEVVAAAKQEKEKSGKGTVIVLVLLILIGIIALAAILWVCGIIPGFGKSSGTDTPTAPSDPPAIIDPVDIPNLQLTITKTEFALVNPGDSALIDYERYPEDSTDSIFFTSENENIATVDEKGKIVAVGNGTVTITVTCGEATQTCTVIVGDGVEPVDFSLDVTQIVLTKVGETKLIYTGPIPVEEITWSTDNEYVATVENGVVTAQASSTATITATYKNVTATCLVTCDIDYSAGGGSGVTEDGGSSGIGGSGGGITEDGGGTSFEGYRIYSIYGPTNGDVTINSGTTLSLYLVDAGGTRVDAQWSCPVNSYISVENGVVKALKPLYGDFILVTAIYEGQSYTCKIRVS